MRIEIQTQMRKNKKVQMGILSTTGCRDIWAADHLLKMQIQMRGRLHVNYFQPHRKATEVATKRLKTSLKKRKIFRQREGEAEPCQVSGYCNSFHTTRNTNTKQSRKTLKFKTQQTNKFMSIAIIPYTRFTLALLGFIFDWECGGE